MIPLLLKAPEGKHVRVVGLGPALLAAIQNFRAGGWPLTVHDPDGAPHLAGLPGIHVATNCPSAGLLRQSSLVLISGLALPDWRSQVRKDLEGSGVPFFDEADAAGSTLRLPAWLPGDSISLAAWGKGCSAAWSEEMLRDFLRGTEGLFLLFLKLVGELRDLLFDSMEETEFRTRVVEQVARPEILTMLLQGDYERAKMAVLKIVGSTTRELEK